MVTASHFLQRTAQFRLKDHKQTYQPILDNIREECFHHIQLQYIRTHPYSQNNQDAFDQLTGTGFPHEFDCTVNDKSNQQNVDYVLYAEITERILYISPENRQLTHGGPSFPILLLLYHIPADMQNVFLPTAAFQCLPPAIWRTASAKASVCALPVKAEGHIRTAPRSNVP